MTGTAMAPWLARWLVDRYPRAWRERYGDEIAEWLSEGGSRPRVVWDLLRGLLDAWAHPRLPASGMPGRAPLSGLVGVGAGYAAFLVAGAGGRKVAEDPRFGQAARIDAVCRVAFDTWYAMTVLGGVAILAVLGLVAIAVVPGLRTNPSTRRAVRILAWDGAALVATATAVVGYAHLTRAQRAVDVAVSLAAGTIVVGGTGLAVVQLAAAVRASRPTVVQIRWAARAGALASAAMAAATVAAVLWVVRLHAVDPGLLGAPDGVQRTPTVFSLAGQILLTGAAAVRVAGWCLPRVSSQPGR